MLRKLFFAVAGVVAMASSAQAELIVTMGDHILQPHMANQIVPVMIRSTTGTDTIAGTTLLVAVNNGGEFVEDNAPGFGGPPGPHITGIDLIGPGAFFASNHLTPETFENQIQLRTHGVGTATGSLPVPATNVVLGFVTLDTTDFGPGVYGFEGSIVDGAVATSLTIITPNGTVDLPIIPTPGSLTIEGDTGGFDGPGSSVDNPIMPDNADKPEDDTSPWVFTEGDANPPWNERTEEGGAWFDPVLADGFYYESTGGTNFVKVGLPVIGDLDGVFKVTAADGNTQYIAEGGTWDFGGVPQSSFTIGGIILPVDGTNPLAFPTFLLFDGLQNSFTMTPLPEPSSILLAVAGMFGLVGYGWRRRRA
jgi:hypothetical protein